jgi:hypothetical protein
LDNTHYYGNPDGDAADWDHNPGNADTSVSAALGSTHRCLQQTFVLGTARSLTKFKVLHGGGLQAHRQRAA